MHAMTVWNLFKGAGEDWLEDKAARLGAALAFYTAFALAPLLVIVIGIAGLVFGHEAAQKQISGQVTSVIGEEGGKAVGTMIESASKPGNGIVGTVLGIVMLFVGATGLFVELQDDLNTIWEVQPKPGRGIWGFVHDRLLSLSMVMGVAFLLLVSLVVSAALTTLGSLMGEVGGSVVGFVIQTVIDLSVITPLFALIFRVLPDVTIAWKDVWFGAIVTAILFIVGKFLIGLYIGQAGVGSAYGAAGSLAVLLIWLYYATQIFFFGAELTKAYANQFGSHVVPTANAEPVTEEARAQQGIPHTSDKRLCENSRNP